jgi:hypothetical protein
VDEELFDEKGRPVVFYYSREKRLQRASQAVRDMNTPMPPHRPNLWRTLTATKPLTFLFISMVTLCAVVLMLSRFFTGESSRTLGSNRIRISAETSGGVSYVTLTKTALDGGAYTGAVDLAFSPAAEKTGTPASREDSPEHSPDAGEGRYQIETLRIYFTAEPEEVFRFSLPLSGKKLLTVMEAGPERIIFSVTPSS